MRLLAGLFALASIAHSADLIVYGGTAAGVITSVAAAREGLTVLLLEPGAHLGGMATSGLSRTDFGVKQAIGGYALEFYRRVGRKYDSERFGNDLAWYYEPHIGETVFREMLAEAKVEVRFHEQLLQHDGVQMQGNRIISVNTGRGAYSAKAFADCSYEVT